VRGNAFSARPRVGGQCGAQVTYPGLAFNVSSYPLKPHGSLASAIGQLLRSMEFLEVGIMALLWAWQAFGDGGNLSLCNRGFGLRPLFAEGGIVKGSGTVQFRWGGFSIIMVPVGAQDCVFIVHLCWHSC
jgi:hypothetical protein